MARPKTINKRYLRLLEALRSRDGNELMKVIVWNVGFHVRDYKDPLKTLKKMIKEAHLNVERRSLWLESRTEQAAHGYRIRGEKAEPTTPELIKFDSIAEPHLVFCEELLKQGWVLDEFGNLTNPKDQMTFY